MDSSKISFKCYDLLGQEFIKAPYSYSSLSPEIHFLVVNVSNDEKVLSSIKEREKDLIEKSGYEKIIGLRDMYGREYKKHSPGVMNKQVSNMIINGNNQTIKGMTHYNRIKLCFAVMEIEAWFLGMYDLFQKIDPLLTVEYIKQNLGIDLKRIDPQKEFYHPYDQVKSISGLCGREYGKKAGEVESICSKMDSSSFDKAVENNRCMSFADFYREITSYS